MSKRARLSEDEASKAGLRAWETPEGRRWLLKALNPNDVSLVQSGLPTLHSRNISVLNWQGEYTMNAPKDTNADHPSWSTTLFLYQHPLIFGVSGSRPNGAIDMSDVPDRYSITRASDNMGTAAKYTLRYSGGLKDTITLTRVDQYLNHQIDPSVFKGNSCLAGRRELFKQLTQKSRITYGGSTLIPTCSSENDSGVLAVCQQVFNARETVIPVDNNVKLNTFMKNDFPSTSDLVQNPQMYYGNYRDGAYIPYKMNNPASFEYVNSEQEITTRSPYFVYEVSFLGTKGTPGSETVETTKTWSTGEIKEIKGVVSDLDADTFEVESSEAMIHCFGVRLYIMSYTGQHAMIDLTRQSIIASQSTSDLFFEGDMGSAAQNTKASLFLNTSETAITENSPGFTYATASTVTTDPFTALADLKDLYVHLPEYITCWNWHDNTYDLANPQGLFYRSKDIDTTAADPALKRCSIPPYNGGSLITVHTSGVSNTAPLKMILRYGSEILLVASSVYSPFKFMSPRYDESAIKSYARCIRSMKDAYFANAGSVIGQADYNNKLMNLVEHDMAGDLNRVLNQGGAWTAAVGAY